MMMVKIRSSGKSLLAPSTHGIHGIVDGHNYCSLYESGGPLGYWIHTTILGEQSLSCFKSMPHYGKSRLLSAAMC